jgi:hypothetical protein
MGKAMAKEPRGLKGSGMKKPAQGGLFAVVCPWGEAYANKALG